MKKIYLCLFAVVMAAGIFAEGTQKAGSLEDKIVITDATGNTVELEKIPTHISFAGRASIMVGDAIYMFPEAQQRVTGVGFTQGSNNFFKVIDKKYADKVHFSFSSGVEDIASADTDLLILKSYMKKKLGDPASRLGIPVVYLNLESPEMYEKDFRVLGKVFDNSRRAEEIISFYKKGMERITSRTEKLEYKDRPDVLFIYHSSRDGNIAFNVPPSSWIQTRMIEMAGGKAIWKDQVKGNGWIKIGFEQIAAWNPDKIYVAAYKQDVKKVVKNLLSSPLWKRLKAVKEGNLKAFPIDFYSWDQPDSRWILGASWLAKEIQPNLFDDFDLKEMTDEFYRKLYYMDSGTIKNEVMARLGW